MPACPDVCCEAHEAVHARAADLSSPALLVANSGVYCCPGTTTHGTEAGMGGKLARHAARSCAIASASRFPDPEARVGAALRSLW